MYVQRDNDGAENGCDLRKKNSDGDVVESVNDVTKNVKVESN